MINYKRKIVEKHIKTHSVHSDEDRAAVSVLETFLRSHGKINTNFSCNDKWPNIDGTLEFVSNPDASRRPEQNFFVQIKGAHSSVEQNGGFKYSLKSLAFPATIYCRETSDPGLLFVVLNPDERANERVFWKYMSLDFLDSIDFTKDSVTIRFSPDEEIMNTEIDTKYLGTFLRGLKYIDLQIPDEGQSERLMLKYYHFLWQIRKFLADYYKIYVLNNLEKFPIKTDELDNEYYKWIAAAIHSADLRPRALCTSRYYVQKKVPFFVENERYYEVVLQLANVYATKYNRITVYTKQNISTNYSVQVAYTDAAINLWGIESKIKIITNWKVSIDPRCLNKLGKVLKIDTRLSSNYGEYDALMNFLTETGISLLDLIDLQELSFSALLNSIYKKTKTSLFKEVLLMLRNNFSKESRTKGRNVIRYLLLELKERTLDEVLVNKFHSKPLCGNLNLSTKCYPFEKNPYISNLAGKKTSNDNLAKMANAVGNGRLAIIRPYMLLKHAIENTGEIYFDANTIATASEIQNYNAHLDFWERNQGYQINLTKGLATIGSYEKTTLSILRILLEISKIGNKGQKELNQRFLRENGFLFNDPLKKQALRDVFVNSRLFLIYGAAGTGKTTLINYVSNLMPSSSKLFLTKTHAAKQNLERRIENPGPSADFISIDSFTKRVTLDEYDIIFVDECSTIDNRTMMEFLHKVNTDTFLVLAGDIYQIESIEFGNWFYYAKDIIQTHGANVELLNTWRTQDSDLISLWDEIRNKGPLITEKLVIDGPFSEDIGPNIFKKETEDEVILCLNYDGKFGLNNINNYFQNANTAANAVSWQEWSYKAGDPILFNDTTRFTLLYNNLKGKIVDIKKETDQISFTVDVPIILTEKNCKQEDITLLDVTDNSSRIRFTVYAYNDERQHEEEEELRKKTVIPFQLAYAVSIHKAQGLEYDSVKIIIPKSNAEKITHGIFYTAVTRAKKKLKIFWSSETMEEIIGSFSANNAGCRSLDIIKNKLRDK